MKILKNTTGSDILIPEIAINIAANSSYTVDAQLYQKLTTSDLLITKITSGDIVYNDGSNDLSVSDAVKHINGYYEKIPRSAIQDAQPVIVHKPENESFARATHDFCDKTTWYTKSVRVEGEVLTNPVGLVYTANNDYFIDVRNGIVNRQDTLQQYAVKVYDGGSEISDYTVDHKNGKITLGSSPSGAVTIDYSYATTSEWVLAPDANTMLIIEHSEVQFATDVQLLKPLRFEIWVYNPADLPNKVLYQAVQYNSVKDLVNEANLGTGTIPAMSGLPECVVFPFNYASIKPLKSSQGAELRIKCIDDEETSGSFGTATFYLIKRDE